MIKPKIIVITGATGGIGREICLAYASKGIKLGLIARDQEKLEALANACRDKGAEVEYSALDVRERVPLSCWLQEFDKHNPIECIIASAGVTCGLMDNGEKELCVESDRVIDVNYKGVEHTISAIVENMKLRRYGQIVLISSLAGMQALPDMPSYSASKAGIIAYGHALRRWLSVYGLKVTIICPGFVTTTMSARHDGSKPFEMSASKAAKIIINAISKEKKFYAFPFLLAAGIFMCKLMPIGLSDWFMKSFRVKIKKDSRY